MHPSKTVAICLFAVAILELASLFVGTELQINVATTVQAFAAILILIASFSRSHRVRGSVCLDAV
jgi:Ca2+/H+ antiporter